MWYNSLMNWLLSSPLHGLLSKSFMLITYTGRKSGQVYTTPVNYVRDGSALTVVSFRQRTWWKNLRGGAPVTVRVQGQDFKATGDVVEDDDGVAATLAAHLQNAPQYAKYLQVKINPDGQPNRDDVVRAARERVMIRVRLV